MKGRTTLTGRRPRVLVAHPSADLYGSDRVLIETVLGFVASGAEVIVALPGDGPLVTELRSHSVAVEFVAMPVVRKSVLRPRGLAEFLRAAAAGGPGGLRLIRRFRPDVVFVNTITVPFWLALAKVSRVPTVCHVHEAEKSAHRALRVMLALPLLLADRLVANSRFSADVVAAAVPRLRGRTEVVYNAVPGPATVQQARSTLTGAVRLLFVGRLSPRKGPAVAVSALADLVGRGGDFHLELVGSVYPGYEWFEDELHEMVTTHGLQERVMFAGFDRDIWPHLAASDVMLVPSVDDEPFGNTAVEAVLGARPAVVSATTGLLEAAEGYGSVVEVAPNRPAELAAAIEKIVADWSTFREVALVDQVKASSRHAVVGYQQRMTAVIDELCGATPRVAAATEVQS